MLKYMTKIFNLKIVFWKNFDNNIDKYFDLYYTKIINKKSFIKTYIFIFTNK